MKLKRSEGAAERHKYESINKDQQYFGMFFENVIHTFCNFCLCFFCSGLTICNLTPSHLIDISNNLIMLTVACEALVIIHLVIDENALA